MKLKKNDLSELRKGGPAALSAKLVELRSEYAKLLRLKMKNELKNLREPALVRRAIAKVMTVIDEFKEIK